jgi:hypothetical protein
MVAGKRAKDGASQVKSLARSVLRAESETRQLETFGNSESVAFQSSRFSRGFQQIRRRSRLNPGCKFIAGHC